MKLLYIDSIQIIKNDILWAALELELNIERSLKKPDIYVPTEQMTLEIMEELKEYDIALTQNFIPDVAEASFRLGKIYVSWIYDAPQISLYRKEALYNTNYIFMFDSSSVNRLKELGMKHVYHQPLASNILKASAVNITDSDIQEYQSDISFVGSLYSREYMKNIKNKITNTAYEDFEKYIDDRCCIYKGNDYYENGFSKLLAQELIEIINKKSLNDYNIDIDYLAESLFGMPALSNADRIKLINKASEIANTRLYTKDDEDISMIKANVYPPTQSDDEMYKIFYSSKINLNITWRGIVTGIPQRIFDIMAVGGFVLSNYQLEIDQLFKIGKEIETYSCIEEFSDKIKYYLKNDEKRVRIGINGYIRVRDEYNCKNALLKMIEVLKREM